MRHEDGAGWGTYGVPKDWGEWGVGVSGVSRRGGVGDLQIDVLDLLNSGLLRVGHKIRVVVTQLQGQMMRERQRQLQGQTMRERQTMREGQTMLDGWTMREGQTMRDR